MQSQDHTHKIEFGIGRAVTEMCNGHKVARRGWNGKNMWISMSPMMVDLEANKFWSPHNRKHAEENGGFATVNESISMKCVDGSIQMGWNASMPDLLANDWFIVE